MTQQPLPETLLRNSKNITNKKNINTMKRKFILVLILGCLFIILYAQKSPGIAKQYSPKVSFSNKKLEAKLDSIFSSFNKTTPGIAVTVLQNGKVLAKKAYGLASLEFKVPFTHSTIVRMAYSEGRDLPPTLMLPWGGNKNQPGLLELRKDLSRDTTSALIIIFRKIKNCRQC